MQYIYIISGPCGVGKSTIAKEVAKLVPNCALVEGDHLLHFYDDHSMLPWEERLWIAWKNLVDVTKNLLQHKLNVVIDFVVEDELKWFCTYFAHLEIQFKYVVLRADKETLVDRITERGDTYMVDRSLFLLNKLENETPFNEPFLYDTTSKQPADIVKDIIEQKRFELTI
ncbi:AAA family ATPase [Bacillus sp. FJAT-49711]|uniref:AAA family ATPase n=1 Tax=Bacillus sp. FJAT-49711 TaxID=2833585 RepID=UPI0032D58507